MSGATGPKKICPEAEKPKLWGFFARNDPKVEKRYVPVTVRYRQGTRYAADSFKIYF